MRADIHDKENAVEGSHFSSLENTTSVFWLWTGVHVAKGLGLATVQGLGRGRDFERAGPVYTVGDAGLVRLVSLVAPKSGAPLLALLHGQVPRVVYLQPSLGGSDNVVLKARYRRLTIVNVWHCLNPATWV